MRSRQEEITICREDEIDIHDEIHIHIRQSHNPYERKNTARLFSTRREEAEIYQSSASSEERECATSTSTMTPEFSSTDSSTIGFV